MNQGNSDQKTSIDLVFVNDTTGSMAGVVQGLTSSIGKFAQDVAQGGVDAKFAMFTYGDAFSTRYDPPSGDDWQGEFIAPLGDNIARPFLNLSDLNLFDGFLQKLRVSRDLGVGGNDAPENTQT